MKLIANLLVLILLTPAAAAASALAAGAAVAGDAAGAAEVAGSAPRENATVLDFMVAGNGAAADGAVNALSTVTELPDDNLFDNAATAPMSSPAEPSTFLPGLIGLAASLSLGTSRARSPRRA